jgi:hypothetical protein
MDPTTSTPRSTVESLQASFGDNTVLKYSKPDSIVRVVMFFEVFGLRPCKITFVDG